jgi:hypothetical protein
VPTFAVGGDPRDCCSASVSEHITAHGDVGIPYPRMAVSIETESGAHIFTLCKYSGGDVYVSCLVPRVSGGWALSPGVLHLKACKEGIRYGVIDVCKQGIETPGEERDAVFDLVLAMLARISCGPVQMAGARGDTEVTAAKKRVARGKLPLWGWKTVTIQLASPRREHAGGTHLSPREHTRRGHWRICSTGTRAWVRDTIVGKRELGRIEKNYVVAGTQA